MDFSFLGDFVLGVTLTSIPIGLGCLAYHSSKFAYMLSHGISGGLIAVALINDGKSSDSLTGLIKWILFYLGGGAGLLTSLVMLELVPFNPTYYNTLQVLSLGIGIYAFRLLWNYYNNK